MPKQVNTLNITGQANALSVATHEATTQVAGVLFRLMPFGAPTEAWKNERKERKFWTRLWDSHADNLVKARKNSQTTFLKMRKFMLQK